MYATMEDQWLIKNSKNNSISWYEYKVVTIFTDVNFLMMEKNV